MMLSKVAKLMIYANVFFAVSVAHSKVEFFCSNQPLKRWQNYFVVQGSVSSADELFLYQYGIVEGSAEAQEMEPVNTVEDLTVRHDSTLAASSVAWKNAKSFNLTTEELGTAVLFIHMDSLVVGNTFTARLIVDQKDVRLSCGVSE